MNPSHPQEVQASAARFLYWGMRMFVALSIGVFLLEHEWVHAVSALAILGLMILPGLLREGLRIYLPFQIDLAIVLFIFSTLFLGSLANFYEKFFWWDQVLHFLSGGLLALVAFVVVYLLNYEHWGKLNLTPFFVSLFAVCFSALISIVWEIYEYSADHLFGFNMQRDGINDTMTDLILNLAASVIVAAIANRWMQRQKQVPFTPSKLSRFQYKGVKAKG